MLRGVRKHKCEYFIEVICDMAEAGVVDSFAVVKTILQDSVSLAGMLITTECLVVKDKTYERKNILMIDSFSFTVAALPRQERVLLII